MTDSKPWLLAAGLLCIAAALLHLACIAGGPDWYRALGAGEPFARAAARGDSFPAIVTSGIAGVLAIWAAYALSAAGLLPALPLRRTALVLITLALSGRGLAIAAPGLWRPDLSTSFKIWSSVAVLILAACFAVGTRLAWPALSHKDMVQ